MSVGCLYGLCHISVRIRYGSVRFSQGSVKSPQGVSRVSVKLL